MLDAKIVKEIALRVGADDVGILPMSRFEGAPKQMDPRYAMPRAKSMIVTLHRVMRGSLRGIEEGTYFGNYSSMSYGYINQCIFPWTAREIARAIEDEGYEAMPLGYQCTWGAINAIHGETWRVPDGYSVPVADGLPRPDIYLSMRIAAWLAGLGEIGYSKVFLSNKYGPRVRIACVMTDLELEPDDIQTPGKICNRCMACARNCPGHAISAERSVKVRIAGYDLEWAELDASGCNMSFVGAEKVKEGERGEYLDSMPENEGQYKPSYASPFRHKPANLSTWGQAICGGRGCTRACLISCEARGVLENKFKYPFRTQPQWKLDWDRKETDKE